MVRASDLQSVDLKFNPLVKSYQKTEKMASTASLLGARHLGEVVENKPASSLVVFLGKALNGTPPPFCERQVAQMAILKRVRTSRPVQNIAIQFGFP